MAISFVASATQATNYGGTSIVVNKPTGTTSGDVMIAVLGGTPATLSGWTLLGSAAGGSSMKTVRAFYKVAGASEPTSYTWTISSSATQAFIATYRGVDNTTPVDTTHFDITGVTSTADFTPTSQTATAAQWGLTFALGYTFNSTTVRTYTESSGTERLDTGVAINDPGTVDAMLTDSNGNLSAGSFSRTQTRSVAADAGVKGVILLNSGNISVTPGTAAATAAAYGATGASTATAGRAQATASVLQATAGTTVIPGCAQATAAVKDVGRYARPTAATATAVSPSGHGYFGAPSFRTMTIEAEARRLAAESERRVKTVDVESRTIAIGASDE
jgi:hypothetical protein